MSTTSLTKALIINLDTGQWVECMFNPKEYTFTKQNRWTQGKNSGNDIPQLEFSNGQPATLKMQIFFDTYASDKKDVRKEYTDHIWSLMMVDEGLMDQKTKKSRPPMVRFQWGDMWSFDAVITNISQKFILFLDNGTPVRAMLDVTFQQVKDTKQLRPQNPSSGGDGGQRVWTTNAGDTLAGIAYKFYGDTSRWRSIANANRLTQVRELTPGIRLVIPND